MDVKIDKWLKTYAQLPIHALFLLSFLTATVLNSTALLGLLFFDTVSKNLGTVGCALVVAAGAFRVFFAL